MQLNCFLNLLKQYQELCSWVLKVFTNTLLTIYKASNYNNNLERKSSQNITILNCSKSTIVELDPLIKTLRITKMIAALAQQKKENSNDIYKKQNYLSTILFIYNLIKLNRYIGLNKSLFLLSNNFFLFFFLFWFLHWKLNKIYNLLLINLK
jgi:hypothetical protein